MTMTIIHRRELGCDGCGTTFVCSNDAGDAMAARLEGAAAGWKYATTPIGIAKTINPYSRSPRKGRKGTPIDLCPNCTLQTAVAQLQRAEQELIKKADGTK